MKTACAVMFVCALGLPMAASAAGPMKPSAAGKLLIDDDTKEFFGAAASANMLEVEASKLALQRASSPEVKAFAQQMVKDHTKASEALKVLAQKKGVTVPTTMMSRHQALYDELEDERTAADFEEAYSEAMVASHKEAVTLFDEVADDAEDPEIRTFAAKMLPRLQSHGGMAKELEG